MSEKFGTGSEIRFKFINRETGDLVLEGNLQPVDSVYEKTIEKKGNTETDNHTVLTNDGDLESKLNNKL